MPEREKLRYGFETRLREILNQGNVSLIAEEAGDDGEVWEHLSREDQLVGGFEALFGQGSRTVDRPMPMRTCMSALTATNPWCHA
jgi:hypothetical protein